MSKFESATTVSCTSRSSARFRCASCSRCTASGGASTASVRFFSHGEYIARDADVNAESIEREDMEVIDGVLAD